MGFYVAFNTVQVISRRVVGRAEETSTYSSLGFCTVNCRPTASNYQLSHLRPRRGSNPGLRGGRRACYHYATVVPIFLYNHDLCACTIEYKRGFSFCQSGICENTTNSTHVFIMSYTTDQISYIITSMKDNISLLHILSNSFQSHGNFFFFFGGGGGVVKNGSKIQLEKRANN